MHGVIPPEPSRPAGDVLAAVAETWAGFPESRVAPQRQGATRAEPLPVPLLSSAQFLLDALCLAVSGVLAGPLAQEWVSDAAHAPRLGLLLLGVGLALTIAAAGGAYRHAALFGGRRALLASLGGLIGAVLNLELTAPLMGAPHALSPAVAGLWLLTAIPMLLANRQAFARVMRAEARRTTRRAVVVGEGQHAARLAAALACRPGQPGAAARRGRGSPPPGRGALRPE
jgi:hypothetical protein